MPKLSTLLLVTILQHLPQGPFTMLVRKTGRSCPTDQQKIQVKSTVHHQNLADREGDALNHQEKDECSLG